MTGSDLHEPKGVASAADGAIATASGGAIAWTDEVTVGSFSISTAKYKSFSLNTLAATSNTTTYNGITTAVFSASQSDTIEGCFVIPIEYDSSTSVTVRLYTEKSSELDTGNKDWQFTYYVGGVATTVQTVSSDITVDIFSGTISARPTTFRLQRLGTSTDDTSAYSVYAIGLEVIYGTTVIGTDTDD